MRPEVSVIIPMFNAGRTIAQAVESLRAQTNVHWEAIVVNDGSTDEGPSSVGVIAGQDARVRLISQPNRGLAAARNSGIVTSQGQFLHFLDADDWLLSGALADLLRTARASSCGAAYGGSAWHDESGASLGWDFEPSCPLVGLRELLDCGRFQPAAQMVARAALGNLSFRSRRPGAEDHDLWLRLAERGVRWAACDRAVCAYRLRREGMSRDFLTMGASLIGATSESFDRSRRARTGEQGADLSFAQEAQIVNRIALEQATGAFVKSPAPGGCDPGRMLLQLGRSARVSADQAAASAYWMIPYADCQSPGAWSDPVLRRRYARHAIELWQRLGESGCAEGDMTMRAAGALAGLVPDTSSIAARIVERVPASSRVMIYGLGRQARALAPRLVAKGIDVVGVDDALSIETREVALGGVTIPVCPVTEGATGSTVCVLAADRDDLMLKRLPTSMRTIRWSDARRDAAEDYRREFRELFAAAGSVSQTMEQAA